MNKARLVAALATLSFAAMAQSGYIDLDSDYLDGDYYSSGGDYGSGGEYYGSSGSGYDAPLSGWGYEDESQYHWSEGWFWYGDYSQVAVYRLASVAGAHIFSKDQGEIAGLSATGAWAVEGIAFRALAGPYGDGEFYQGTKYWYDFAVPLYRLSNRINGDYFFSANADEVNALVASGIWNCDGISCYVDSGKYGVLYGSIPVYRLYSPVSGQHLFSLDENERDAIVATGAWVNEGIAFYALPTTVEISLWDSMTDFEDSFRVTYGDPLPNITPPSCEGYVFEGYGWSYWTSEGGQDIYERELVYDATGHSDMTAKGNYSLGAFWISPAYDASLCPVFRLRCAVNGDYLFTLNAAERDIINADPFWTYEGVAFYAYDDFASGTVPLYRFISVLTGEHFMTANETEKNALGQSPWWRYDGILCFVSGSGGSGTVPVNRMCSPATGLHLFTMTEAEQSWLMGYGWANEGIAFHVWPAQ